MKRVIKGAIVFMLLYFCIMGNQQTIHAETVDVQNEYLQKKSAGREVYEITSQSGKFMGNFSKHNKLDNNNSFLDKGR